MIECDISTKFILKPFQNPNEYDLIISDNIYESNQIKIYYDILTDNVRIYSFNQPIEYFLYNVLLGYNATTYNEKLKLVVRQFDIDKNRQTIQFCGKDIRHVYNLDYIALDNFYNVPMLMAICNQVACVPMMIYIMDYIRHTFGTNVLLSCGNTALIFDITPMKKNKKYSYDDHINKDLPCIVSIKKTMNMILNDGNEIKHIGTCCMCAKFKYFSSIDYTSFFGKNIQYTYIFSNNV